MPCHTHRTRYNPDCDACRHAEVMEAFRSQSVWLQTISDQLKRIEQKEIQMSAELDALTADVANETAVDQSAITLINGIAAKLDAMKNDPAAIAALSTQLKSSSAALAAAVTANTPAEPPVVTP